MKNKYLSKIISIVLLVSIVFCFSAVYAEGSLILSDTAHEYFKIGLSFGSNAVQYSKIESINGFLLVDCSNDGWGAIKDLTANKELYVIYDEESGYIVIIDNANNSVIGSITQGQALIAASTSLDSQYVKVDGKTYRDGVCFTLNEDKTLNVINYIELEHYLWGVMKNEIGDQYPEEALKSFAVSTRSFAYANRGSHSKYGFDLCTGDECQMYRGVSAESAACTAAYKATAGLVMKYNGKLATGNHYANSGGHTLNSEDAWVSAVPYLRAVEDPYSPEYTWDVSYSYAQVKSKLQAQGINVGDVLKVEISSATDYGAVLELTITGTEGSATLSKGKIKSTFSLRSQLFTLNPEIENADSDSTEEPSVFLMGADGIAVKTDLKDLVVFDGEKTVSGSALDWTGFGEKAVSNASADDMLTFHGRGNGHGVGMSQSGIKVMSQQGFKFDEILKFYFTGITIESK